MNQAGILLKTGAATSSARVGKKLAASAAKSSTQVGKKLPVARLTASNLAAHLQIASGPPTVASGLFPGKCMAQRGGPSLPAWGCGAGPSPLAQGVKNAPRPSSPAPTVALRMRHIDGTNIDRTKNQGQPCKRIQGVTNFLLKGPKHAAIFVHHRPGVDGDPKDHWFRIDVHRPDKDFTVRMDTVPSKKHYPWEAMDSVKKQPLVGQWKGFRPGEDMAEQLRAKFRPGRKYDEYDLFANNCQHFAQRAFNDLCGANFPSFPSPFHPDSTELCCFYAMNDALGIM